MRSVVVAAFLVGCLAWSNATVQAGFVFMNNIDGANPAASNPFTAGQVVDSNITVTGIGRGPSITADAAQNRYSAGSWSSAFAADRYFTFALSPNPGFQISFTDVEVTIQRSNVVISNFVIRSDRDSFAANIATLNYGAGSGNPSATATTIDLTGLQFQNVAEPIEFRLYAWGATNASNTFSVNSFSFNGSVSAVSAVPEPSSIACIALAGIFGAARCLMRRR